MPTHPEPTTAVRRLPVGAEVQPDGGVHFRVWAPRRKTVEVVCESGAFRLSAEQDGYFSGFVADAVAGARYRFRLDGGEQLFPDPASRFQPEGVHGFSEVIDPSRFRWTDHDWRGVSIEGQVIYEMHIGTFTPDGTYESAIRELPELARAGITVLEVMPVADFPGRFGWGYDGVDLYAPTGDYGRPDDLRKFVSAAHEAGLAVILDVVYNHIGPDGNYLKEFAEEYFTNKYENEWGEAINFDGPNSAPVREFFISNAGYWIDEFHFDGLRLDATQSIIDNSPEHVLVRVSRRVREAANGRRTIIVAENEPQETRLVRSVERGGYGLDALWNDDFHHSAMAAMTGRNEAYYSDHRGAPQEFISAAKYGYLYQGQLYSWQGKRRGSPALDLAPAAFVNFLQNHDQIANSGRGLRCHALTSPGRYRAMMALMLLSPGTPMLFQGQEFAASAPFFFFADHTPDLARLVREGRADFLAQFPGLKTPEMRAILPDPGDRRTFERSKLDLAEREKHAGDYALTRDLLRIRREHAAFRAQHKGRVDGAVLGAEAFLLRFFDEHGDDRLLLVNLGLDLSYTPAPEPLLAPPEGMRWHVLLHTEEPKYGGSGAAPVESLGRWRIPGHAAAVLYPRPVTPEEIQREKAFATETSELRKREKYGDE